jgi:hypothetical protein
MSRLRVRIELNRGGVGVPLEKLASVVQQAQSFFRMLGDDVHIDQSQGEWLGFDFDHESLNFTAEFVGPVTQDQVAAFHSAFDGTTGLRRATIAQFARIADGIDEDEVIGFGLYLNEGDDPAEWRCLSRRDALRISEEIRVLLGAGESGQESHLPAVADVNTGARYLFGKRDRGVETAKLAGAVREVEASLSKRLSRLEGEVADHSSHIHDLRSKSVEAEQSMGRLLSAVEGFCEQAAQRLETVTAAPALAAAARVPIAAPSVEDVPEVPILSEAPPKPVSPPDALLGKVAPDTPLPLWGTARVSTAAPFGERIRSSWWRSATAISIGLGAAVILLGMALWPNASRPGTSASEPARNPSGPAPAVVAASTPNPAPAAVPPKAAAPNPAPSPIVPQKPEPVLTKPTAQAAGPAVVGATRIQLEASEPSWISIRSSDGTTVARLIEPGSSQSVDIREPAVLRAGNAGGLTIHTNGKSVGPLGPHGAIREVEFKNGGFKVIPVK